MLRVMDMCAHYVEAAATEGDDPHARYLAVELPAAPDALTAENLAAATLVDETA
jgi:hypothetical protein